MGNGLVLVYCQKLHENVRTTHMFVEYEAASLALWINGESLVQMGTIRPDFTLLFGIQMDMQHLISLF